MRKAVGIVGYIIAALVIASICGVLLMTAVYLIPTDRINKNVAASAEIFDREGLTNSYIPWMTSTRMDNYTDSIMLSEAAYNEDASALKKAMSSKYVYVINEEDYYQPGYLNKMLLPVSDSSAVVSYARYWHGYLLAVKPLLVVVNLYGIRVINALVQIALLALLVYKLFKTEGGKKLIIPLLLSVFLINPVSTVLNMQYACVYTITLAGSLALVWLELYKTDKYWRLFLFLGIAVAFFDFLTYPLASLGIPLVILIVLGREDSRKSLKQVIASGCCWGVGYAFMWASKWVLCDLLTGSSIVKDALNQVLVRTVTNAYEETGISSDNVLDVISYNMDAFRDPVTIMVFVLAIAGFVLFIVFGKKKFKLPQNLLLPLLVLAIVPFVWFCVLSNHSAIHFWMTYRNIAVTVMAIGAALSESISAGGQYGN